MEIKVTLDKENNVFLNKTFDLDNAIIDDDGNFVLKGENVEIKITPLDSMKLAFLSMQLLSKMSGNLFILFNKNLDLGGENNESDSK